MLIFLTAAQRNLFAAIALVAIAYTSPAAAAHQACNELFSKNAEAWPPPSWKTLLTELAATHGRKSQPFGIVPRVEIPSPREDSRLYGNSGNFLWPGHRFAAFQEDDIRAEISSVSKHYEYLASASPHGGPYIINSKALGRGFDVFDLPRLKEFGTKEEYAVALHKYLDRIENIVREGTTYPEYDEFFNYNRVRHGWDEEEKKAVDEGQFLGRTQKRKDGSHIEAYPIENIEGTAFVRYAYRETYLKDGLKISVIGTRIAGAKKDRDWLVAKKANGEALADGIARHRRWVIDLVAEVYPDYVQRRHWTRSFIEADFAEVLETINSTDYIEIRKADDGASAPLLASMGFNRASYGKAQGYNAHKKTWEEMSGGFGSSYYDDYPDARSSLPVDTSIIKEGPVPLLKMEAYLGASYRLSRPSRPESIRLDQHTPRFVNGEFVGKTPVYMEAGEIFEPVKFFLARKESKRHEALTELFNETTRTLFPYNRSCNVSVCGQALYTMNPKVEGTRLYAKRGMNLRTEYIAAQKDGTEWHVFGSTVSDYVKMFHELSEQEQASDEGSAKHITVIRDLTQRVLEAHE